MARITIPEKLSLVPLWILCASFHVTACSGNGSAEPAVAPIVAGFVGSGTSASLDRVRLTGSASGDTITVNVVIAGATTSTDLYSFAFDLLLGDDGVAQYIDQSVTFGHALTLSGAQQGVALAQQNGTRIKVGVSKIGGGGNGVGPSEEPIVSLKLRVIERGATTLAIVGSPPNPPSALDSGGTVLNSVVFDGVAAAISGT